MHSTNHLRCNTYRKNSGYPTKKQKSNKNRIGKKGTITWNAKIVNKPNKPNKKIISLIIFNAKYLVFVSIL